MARPNPPRKPAQRSARALGATIAITGLIFYQSSDIGATSQDREPSSASSAPSQEAAPKVESTHRAEKPLLDPEVQASSVLTDEAEQIARLERQVRENRQELERQREQLQDGPESDYRRAESEYSRLDQEFQKKEKALDEATNAGDQETIATLNKELEELNQRRQLAKDRFELEVRERKSANERVEILNKTLAADEKLLKELLGEAGPEPASTPPKDSTSPPAETTPMAPSAPGSAETGQAAESAPDPATATNSGGSANPLLPGLNLPGKSQAPEPKPAAERSAEVVRAEKQVQAKSQAAENAERRSQSLDDRLALLDRNIATVREQLSNAQLKADNAEKTRDLLTDEFRNKSIEGAEPPVLRALRLKIQEAEAAVREARAEVRDRASRLENLNLDRTLIIEARQAVDREATAARRDLESAREALREASNPFSPRNISRWALTRGPGILSILLISALLIWLINRFGQRIASLVAHRSSRGSQVEREARATTLVSVFQNAATAVIVVGGGIMALDQAGVPIAPLLGGAAVFGLAISFGAQNLVSDFFYGFMILLENQYKLNDVVKINDHSGQVEQITLRMTALRDLEGNLHFIPNGQINAVINMTHGWSRALFDISVAYKENVDRVMEVIMDIGKELRTDPRFRPLILEDPMMLGVDSLAESAVVIKFFIKTRPLQQWAVKREMNRRIKNRFDELGIEIPYPHRTVYYRTAAQSYEHIPMEGEHVDADSNGG